MRRFALAAIVVTTVLASGWALLPVPGGAQEVAPAEPADLALLHALAQVDAERVSPPDIRFEGPEGAIRQGVRCATRAVTEAEIELASRVARSLGGPASREPISEMAVPVVVHVVTTRLGKFAVPRRQIVDQVDVLNEAFSDRGFRFELVAVRRHVDSRFAKNCGNRAQERRFKTRNAVDPARVLNVYTCRPTRGVLGYSWFPSDWSEDSPMHGIVVRHSTLPGGAAAPYNEGDTAVHEVGHWAGLYHTFEGGCGGQGDRVDDTPSQSSPTYGCPPRRDSCPGRPGDDPIQNFMDYTDDACMDTFTGDQGERMQIQTQAFRPALVRAAAGS